MPDGNGSLFKYEEMYEWLAAGNRGTIQEMAEQFDMEVPTAYAFCNFIASKYQVPLYSLGGVYAIHWDVDESAALAGVRSKDVVSRMKKGMRLCVDNLVEVIALQPPKKRAKLNARYDMFIATCKYLAKQADALLLEEAKEGPEQQVLELGE